MTAQPIEAVPSERARHWDRIWRESDPTRLSWFQPRPETSLTFIERAGLPAGARVLDVGGGASTLADNLLDLGYRPGVLDVSEEALARSRARLGARMGQVEWFHADVTRWNPPHTWDLWHDRAVLHFLIDEEERRAYRATLLNALRPDGHLVLAVFGPEGPTTCSGLEVRRHSAEDLEALLGPEFQLQEQRTEEHLTPSGRAQRFLFCRFVRVPLKE